MMGDKTPAWGSPEFQKAIEDHDAEADPKREETGQKYTKKPAAKPKSQADDKKGGGGKKKR